MLRIDTGIGAIRPVSFMAVIFLGFAPSAMAVEDVFVSHGRLPDSNQKIMSEIRDDEKRRIPLDVALKARREYAFSDPVAITVTVTNLFDPPLLLNSRLLVNHRLLPGELSFLITDPDGKRCEIQRLVSAMDIRDEDFVSVPRGMSIQRTIDLGDFFQMRKKGTYNVRVIYHNSVDQTADGRRAWVGALASEATDIELK
jgi:hypothetical protein